MGYKFGGRAAGTKNKATLERENMISRAMGELDRPLGKDVLAEVMVEFREMAKEQAEAARAGDKQQKRVYYQGTLETDKGELSVPSPCLAPAGTAGQREGQLSLPESRRRERVFGWPALLTGGGAKRASV